MAVGFGEGGRDSVGVGRSSKTMRLGKGITSIRFSVETEITGFSSRLFLPCCGAAAGIGGRGGGGLGWEMRSEEFTAIV